MNHLWLVAAMAFGVLDASPDQRCRPIAEFISARPVASSSKPFEIVRSIELPAFSFDDVIAASDLVVEGSIVQMRSYLSDDGCTVLTDHSVSVMHVHRGAMPAATKPGIVAPLVFTEVGGELVVDGVRVIFHISGVEPFVAGQNVIVALSGKPGGFTLANGSYGAFALKDGTVKHMLRSGGDPVLPSMDRAAFIARVRSARQR